MLTKLMLLMLLFSSFACADNGIIKIKSPYSVKQTTKNLVKLLKKKKMTLFKVINHKKGAKKVGQKLRPSTVVIFGNPKIGTPLMNCAPSVAIDLPQKALIYQDQQGVVWYAYNNPNYLKQRHNIKACDKILAKISHALANFAKGATK